MARRSVYDYREDTVALSDHAWLRAEQRLGAISAQGKLLVRDRALAAAGHPANREHTGVRVLTENGVHVWVVVAGRTVKTVLTTPEGVHLCKVSQCNRYAVVDKGDK